MIKTQIEQEELVRQALKRSISYADYRLLVDKHASTFTSTGHTQTEALSNYTILNNKRMKRWDKTLKLDPEHKAQIEKFDYKMNWLVLTESWCGDAAHTIPVMNALANCNENIELSIVLRDDNPQLMDAFLTNGSMSIPKLIIQDDLSKGVLGSWGPRPSTATNLVEDYKSKNELLTPVFKEELQMWYNKDKGQTTASDIVNLIESFYPQNEI